MSHIPQCDCSQCITYRLHACLPTTEETVVEYLDKETQKLERYEKFDALLSEIKALHDSKGADYADYEGSGVPYVNLRASEEWGVPAWVYAMTRCEEKMRRIKTFAKGSTLKHEGARDSLMDIAVLSLIAIVLMEEKE